MEKIDASLFGLLGGGGGVHGGGKGGKGGVQGGVFGSSAGGSAGGGTAPLTHSHLVKIWDRRRLKEGSPVAVLSLGVQPPVQVGIYMYPIPVL